MNQLQIITSQKGGQKLLLNGFSYTVKTKSKHSIRWECSERRFSQCQAKLTTKLDDNENTTILSQTPHSHGANPTEIAVLKEKINLKRKWNQRWLKTSCNH